MTRSLRFLLLACTLTACSDATTEPRLAEELSRVTAVVLSDTLSPGEITSVSFVNSGAASWTVNTCRRQMEQLIFNRWTLIGPEVRLCEGEGALLAPGNAKILQADVGTGLEAGIYRMRFPVNYVAAAGLEDDEPRLEVVSTPFQVR
jgi:hypothetical protein